MLPADLAMISLPVRAKILANLDSIMTSRYEAALSEDEVWDIRDISERERG